MVQATKLNDTRINGVNNNIAQLKERGERIARVLYRDESGSPTYNRNQRKASHAILNCANELHFIEDTKGHKRMHNTYFCHNALCPVCEVGRYNRDSARLYRVMNYIEHNPVDRVEYLFVTFTMQNVDDDGIRNAIELMNYAWNKMKNYKAIKPYVLGTIKRIEDKTNNADGTFNVHVHMLMLVRPTFYGGKARLNHAQWSKLWTRALNQGYTADIKVSRVKDFEQALQKMHYMVKVNEDIAQINPDATDEELNRIIQADNGKYRKHLLTLTGIFKAVDSAINIKRRNPDKHNNNTGKHIEYSEPDEFDYSNYVERTYAFDTINGQTDYYLIE